MNLRIKTNVILVYSVEVERIIAGYIQSLEDVVGQQYIGMVTSGCDGTHAKESAHYRNEAVDFRKWDLDVKFHRPIVDRAVELLNDNPQGRIYLAVNKINHFHVQLWRS